MNVVEVLQRGGMLTLTPLHRQHDDRQNDIISNSEPYPYELGHTHGEIDTVIHLGSVWTLSTISIYNIEARKHPIIG